MGTFSIWHWIIVLIVLGVWFIPLVAVYRENSNKIIGRLGFLKWLGIFYGIPIVSVIIGRLDLIEENTIDIIGGLGYLCALIFVYPFFQNVVRRSRDSGMEKLIAYLTIIPLVDIITILILVFKRTKPQSNISETYE